MREISTVLAGILARRGIGIAEAGDYLAPKLRTLLPDPLVLKDMDVAVARVAAALVKSERIAVFGDYDVDGSTSAALLSDFLGALGASPRIYIPDRMTEGYCPSPAAMRALHAEGIMLVITVDCGAGGRGGRQGPVHALSSGLCVRPAHQCRRPGGALLAGGGFADGARCRQGECVRRPARSAQQGTPGDRETHLGGSYRHGGDSG